MLYKCVEEIKMSTSGKTAFTKDRYYTVKAVSPVTGCTLFRDDLGTDHTITMDTLKVKFEKATTPLANLKDMNAEDALERLKEYCNAHGINIDEIVYKLTVEDVLVCLANIYKKGISSGEYTVEDCIDIIKRKMDIDWENEMQSTIDTRLPLSE